MGTTGLTHQHQINRVFGAFVACNASSRKNPVSGHSANDIPNITTDN